MRSPDTTCLGVGSLLCLALFTACPGAETWRPADHPAVIERHITGVTQARAEVLLGSEIGGRVTAVT
ncbi:MAG: hypothetical protein ACYTF0_09555, partial [Planctomycetota bacterium]